MSVVRCPRCPKTWTGTTASHCTVCHETFSVDSNGDRHRKGKGADRHCVDPSTVGLVLNKRGRWAMPGGERGWEQSPSVTTAGETYGAVTGGNGRSPLPCPGCGLPTWDGIHATGHRDCFMGEVPGV